MITGLDGCSVWQREADDGRVKELRAEGNLTTRDHLFLSVFYPVLYAVHFFTGEVLFDNGSKIFKIGIVS